MERELFIYLFNLKHALGKVLTILIGIWHWWLATLITALSELRPVDQYQDQLRLQLKTSCL